MVDGNNDVTGAPGPPVGEVGPPLTHCTRPVHEDDPPAEIYKLEDDTNWRINRYGVLPAKRLYSRAPFEYYTDPDPLEENLDAPIDVVFVSTASGDNYITVDKRRCTEEKCPLPHCFPNERANRPRPIRVSARAERFARLPEDVHIQVTQRIISTERVGDLSNETKYLESIPVKPYRFGDAVVDVEMLPYPLTTTGSTRLGIVDTRAIEVWTASNYWSVAMNAIASAGDLVLAYNTLTGQSETRNQILAFTSLLNGVLPNKSVIQGVGPAFRRAFKVLRDDPAPREPKAVPDLASVLNGNRIRTSRTEPTISRPPESSTTRVWGSDDQSAAFRLTVSFNEMIFQLEAAKYDLKEDAKKANLPKSKETIMDLIARLRVRLLALKQINNVALLDALLLSRPSPTPRMLGKYVVYYNESVVGGVVRQWSGMNAKEQQNFMDKVSWGTNKQIPPGLPDPLAAPAAPVAAGAPAAPTVPAATAAPAAPTVPTAPAVPATPAVGAASRETGLRRGLQDHLSHPSSTTPTIDSPLLDADQRDMRPDSPRGPPNPDESSSPTSLDSLPKLAPTGEWVLSPDFKGVVFGDFGDTTWSYKYRGEDRLFINYSNLSNTKLDNSYTELSYSIVGVGARVDLTTTRHASTSAADHYLSRTAEVKNLVAIINIFEELLFEDFDEQAVPNAETNSWLNRLKGWMKDGTPLYKRFLDARKVKQILLDTGLKNDQVSYEGLKVLPVGSDACNIALVLSDIKSNFEATLKPRSDPLKDSLLVLMADYKMVFPSSWPLSSSWFDRKPPELTPEESDELAIINQTSEDITLQIRTAYYSFPANFHTPDPKEYQNIFKCLKSSLDIDLAELADWLRDVPPQDSSARIAWKDGNILEPREISKDERILFRKEIKAPNQGLKAFVKMHVAVAILKDVRDDTTLPDQLGATAPTTPDEALNLLARLIASKSNKLYILKSTQWLLRAAAYFSNKSILLYTTTDVEIKGEGIPFTAQTFTTEFVRLSIRNQNLGTLDPKMALLQPKRKLMRRIACVAKVALPRIKLQNADIIDIQDIGQKNTFWDGSRLAPLIGWAARLGLQIFGVPVVLQWFSSAAVAATNQQAAASFLSFLWASPFSSTANAAAVIRDSAAGYAGYAAAGSVGTAVLATITTALGPIAFPIAAVAAYSTAAGVTAGTNQVLEYVSEMVRSNEPTADSSASPIDNKPKSRKDWGLPVFVELIETAYMGKSDQETKANVKRITAGLLYNVTESFAASGQVAVRTWFLGNKANKESAKERDLVLRGEPIISCVARMRAALDASRNVDNDVSNMNALIERTFQVSNSVLDVSLNLDVSRRFYMDELWEDTAEARKSSYNQQVAENILQTEVAVSTPRAPHTGFFNSSIPPKVVRVEVEDALERRGFYNLGQVVGVDGDMDLDSKLAVRELSDAVYTCRLGSYYEAVRSAYEAWITRILKCVVALIKRIYASKIKFAVPEDDLVWQQTQCGSAALLMLRHAPTNAHGEPTKQMSELIISYANRLASVKAMPQITSSITTSQLKAIARMQGISSRGPQLMVTSSTVLTKQLRELQRNGQIDQPWDLNADKATLPAPTVQVEDVHTQRAVFAARRINRGVIAHEISRLSNYKPSSSSLSSSFIIELTDNLARPVDGALYYHPFGSPLRLTPTRGSIGDRVISTRRLQEDLRGTREAVDSSVNAWVTDNSTMSGLAQHPYVLSVKRPTSEALLSVHTRLLRPNVKQAPRPQAVRALDVNVDSMATWNTILEELFNVDRILAAAALIRSSGEMSMGLEFEHPRAKLWIAIASQLAYTDGFVVELSTKTQASGQTTDSEPAEDAWLGSLSNAPQYMQLVEVLASL